MKENRKPILKKVFGALRIIVPLGLMALLLSHVNWQEVLPLLEQVSWRNLVVSMLAFLLSQFVIAVRWQYLLRVQEIHIPLTRLTWLVLIGAFASNFLPTTVGGDLVKMAAVTQGQSRRSVAVASVVADRLFNLASMVLWIPFAFTLGLGSANLTGPGLMSSLTRIPFVEKIMPRLKRVYEAGAVWFKSPRTVIIALVLSWVSVGLSYISFWSVTLALGIEISFWQLSGVAVISYFVALLPLSVNGLGLLEGSEVALLLSQGASYEQGLAAAVLIRLVTMAVSLLGGARLLWWRGLLAEAVAQQAEIREG